MEYKPLITVIIPVYNVEEYLNRCICSVINQSYKFLEIILVDDGSLDNSGRFCDEYACIDDRIKVVHKDNGGLSSARNYGLDIANGDYVSFIDSDDYVSPYYIETMLLALQETGADICISSFIKGYASTYEFKDGKGYNAKTFSSEECLMQWHSKYRKNETVAWAKLYRRNVFENVRFPEGKTHEDIYTTHILINNARKICFIGNKLYYYFQRKGSIVNTKSFGRIVDNCDAMKCRMYWFVEKGYVRAARRLKLAYLFHLTRFMFGAGKEEKSYLLNKVYELTDI